MNLIASKFEECFKPQLEKYFHITLSNRFQTSEARFDDNILSLLILLSINWKTTTQMFLVKKGKLHGTTCRRNYEILKY